MTVARKGVGALAIAYAILFVLIGAVLAVVTLGRDRNEVVLSLRTPDAVALAPPAPAASIASQPSPQEAVARLPPAPEPPAPASVPVPDQAPPAAADAPTPLPAPVSANDTAAPDAPAEARPETPVDDKPAETAVAALARTTLYPPPPPEKPQPPVRAAAAAAPAQDAAAAAQPASGAVPASLQEPGPHGPLPRIAPDGRLPWIINNARFDHGTRKPRLGIVLTGLGYNPQITEDAIVQLPPEVTLAFVPYADNLPRWIALAREFGHEVLISLPLEGGDSADPGLGPRMLSTQASTAENLDRLRWILSRGLGYVGVVTWEGERLLGSGDQSLPILQEVAKRGLLVVDSRQARSNIIHQNADQLGLPFARSRGFLDSEPGAAALDRNLQQFEAIAQRSGFAVAMAVAFPETVRRLADWSKTVGQRGFVLAPVTGVSECKDLCQQRVARHGQAVSPARQ